MRTRRQRAQVRRLEAGEFSWQTFPVFWVVRGGTGVSPTAAPTHADHAREKCHRPNATAQGRWPGLRNLAPLALRIDQIPEAGPERQPHLFRAITALASVFPPRRAQSRNLPVSIRRVHAEGTLAPTG